MNNYSIIEVKSICSDMGDLSIMDGNMLPFQIKRVYYITNVNDYEIVRGNHAHKKLQQIMICLGGSCQIILDNSIVRETIKLDNPRLALYIRPCVWREISHFSKNATLMVLASEEYDEDDYIRDYNEFKDYMKGIK